MRHSVNRHKSQVPSRQIQKLLNKTDTPRNLKQIIFQISKSYTTEIHTTPINTSADTIKHNNKLVHTTIVKDYFSNGAPNHIRLTIDQVPTIIEMEQTLFLKQDVYYHNPEQESHQSSTRTNIKVIQQHSHHRYIHCAKH
jgi:hypothetical protein